MRYNLLIKITLLIFINLSFGETGLIKVLRETPYVDKAKQTLYQIKFQIEQRKLKPNNQLIDGLIPIIKNEPYLIKPALDILYLLPEDLINQRKDLITILKQKTKYPEVMQFLSKKLKNKEILLRLLTSSNISAASKALEELIKLPLNKKDLKFIIENHLTKHPDNYFYVIQYIQSHQKNIPAISENALKKLSYLLMDPQACFPALQIYSKSGKVGIQILFDRYFQGFISDQCRTYTFEDVLRKNAPMLHKKVEKLLKEEKDPLVLEELLILLIEAGKTKEAEKHIKTLSNQRLYSLSTRFPPEKLIKTGFLSILEKKKDPQLNYILQNLKSHQFCFRLKNSDRKTTQSVLRSLHSSSKKTVIQTLQNLQKCRHFPEKIKAQLINLAVRSKDLQIKTNALWSINSNPKEFCRYKKELFPLLDEKKPVITGNILGIITVCKTSDRKVIQKMLHILKNADTQTKQSVIQTLLSLSLYPPDTPAQIQNIIESEKDPAIRNELKNLYIRSLVYSNSAENIKKYASMVAKGKVEETQYYEVPQKFKAVFENEFLKNIKWWKKWMISRIEIQPDKKAVSIIKTTLNSKNKPFSERLKRLEMAVKIDKNSAEKFTDDILTLFKENTEKWVYTGVSTPNLNKILGCEGKKILIKLFLKDRKIPTEYRFYNLNTKGFVSLPLETDTVEFFIRILKSLKPEDTGRFLLVADYLNETLEKTPQEKRKVFLPLVPYLKKFISSRISEMQLIKNSYIRKLIGKITSKTPPLTPIEQYAERQLKPLIDIENKIKEKVRKAIFKPAPFKVDTAEEYALKDGRKILLISFILPENHFLINPEHPFCIDHDKNTAQNTELNQPADKSYRWYFYKIIRKGYKEPEKLKLLWSNSYTLKEGSFLLQGEKKQYYRYYTPDSVFISYIRITHIRKKPFKARIKELSGSYTFELSIPVNSMNFMAMEIQPLENKRCSTHFKLRKEMVRLYNLTFQQVLNSTYIVISPAGDYRFKLTDSYIEK